MDAVVETLFPLLCQDMQIKLFEGLAGTVLVHIFEVVFDRILFSFLPAPLLAKSTDDTAQLGHRTNLAVQGLALEPVLFVLNLVVAHDCQTGLGFESGGRGAKQTVAHVGGETKSRLVARLF